MTDALATAESVRWAVSRLSTRLRAEQPGDAALTRLSASLLANLRHGGAATVTGLAEVEGLAPQSLTRTLHTLESQGRISRERDEFDRRAQRITLTEAGRAALDEHVAAGNRWLAQTLASVLTPAECRVLDVAAELLMTVAAHDDPSGRARRAHRRVGGLPAPPL